MSDAQPITSRLVEKFTLHADAGRALRTALAFGIPLAVCHAMHRPVDAVFIALSAQIIAMQDLRGAYRVRMAIIVVMTLVASGAAMLGVVAGGNVFAAMTAMALIAVFSGVWRHLSADYGPPMGVSSALLLLLGMAQPGGLDQGLHLAGQVLIGGCVAAVLHIGFWLFRPQHALRSAVAETWVAASDLVAKMRLEEDAGAASRGNAIAASERDLRTSLDRTFVILGAGGKGLQNSLIAHLEEMRREVVHFSMRVIAFNNSLEALQSQPDYARNLPVIDSLLKALGDAARSVAITLITHRPENFASSEVRLQRCGHLARVLDRQLGMVTGDLAVMQTRATLGEIGQVLPRIRDKLGETTDHSAMRSMFPQILPEIGGRSIQSLAAWINPRPHLDPVLVRYSTRMAVVTMLAVALYKGFDIPRGYWAAFTIIVVLQPDFGSTRERAGQRIGGTLAGVILGSALLWVSMPLFVIDGLAIVTSFCFAWFVKRRYGIGIFFVTLMLVLITETMAPVKMEFTILRLVCTLCGGAMALIAALVFWPVWEGRKFPSLLAGAIRANRIFLKALFPAFEFAGDDAATGPLMARRRAENANRYAAESLKRMTAEPSARDDIARRHASLATYNQRITRALTAMAVHAEGGIKLRTNSLMPDLVRDLEVTLGNLAAAVEEVGTVGALNASLEKIEALIATIHIMPPKDTPGELSKAGLVWTQLAKCIGEIRAMALAMDQSQAASR